MITIVKASYHEAIELEAGLISSLIHYYINIDFIIQFLRQVIGSYKKGLNRFHNYGFWQYWFESITCIIELIKPCQANKILNVVTHSRLPTVRSVL